MSVKRSEKFRAMREGNDLKGECLQTEYDNTRLRGEVSALKKQITELAADNNRLMAEIREAREKYAELLESVSAKKGKAASWV